MSASDLPESADAGFDAMGLHEALLAGIRAHGLSAPRVFQQQVITALIELQDAHDMVVQAPFLSGKTIAVCIGLLQRCDFSGKGLQALIICPTRELTHLTFDMIKSLGKHLANDQPFCIRLDGEGSFWEQRTALKSSNTVIAVGTPGRIASLWSAVPTKSLETVVFDDAEDLIELDERIKRDKEKRTKQQQRTTQQSNAVDDEDKNDGEKEEAFDFGIDIAAKLPPTTQRVVCFAVKTESVRKLTETLRATEVVAPSPRPPFTAVKHLYVKVSDQEAKLAMVAKLCAVISAPTVVYVDRPRKAVALTNTLMEAGINVSSFHDDVPRGVREANLAAFRSGSTPRVLVATDMVNYGEHGAVCVINSDLPWEGSKYARRLCRPYGNYRPMVMISLVRDVDVRWFDKNRLAVGSENVVEVEEAHFEAFFRAMPLFNAAEEMAESLQTPVEDNDRELRQRVIQTTKEIEPSSSKPSPFFSHPASRALLRLRNKYTSTDANTVLRQCLAEDPDDGWAYCFAARTLLSRGIDFLELGDGDRRLTVQDLYVEAYRCGETCAALNGIHELAVAQFPVRFSDERIARNRSDLLDFITADKQKADKDNANIFLTTLLSTPPGKALKALDGELWTRQQLAEKAHTTDTACLNGEMFREQIKGTKVRITLYDAVYPQWSHTYGEYDVSALCQVLFDDVAADVTHPKAHLPWTIRTICLRVPRIELDPAKELCQCGVVDDCEADLVSEEIPDDEYRLAVEDITFDDPNSTAKVRVGVFKERPVVIKTFADRPQFLSELDTVIRLGSHPHIITFYGFVDCPHAGPWIVMERGETLEAVARPCIRTLASYGRQMIAALQHAHRKDIFHWDLKRQNMVLVRGAADETPTLKLIDFGMATYGAADFLGTHTSWAPEQADRGFHNRGAHTDAFLVAATLYELHTGFALWTFGGTHIPALPQIVGEYERLREASLEIPITGVADAPLLEFLSSALRLNPRDRATLEVMDHRLQLMVPSVAA